MSQAQLVVSLVSRMCLLIDGDYYDFHIVPQ